MGIYGIKKESINEVYFGETKEIKQLQKALSELRASVLRSDNFLIKKANTLPEVLEFNRIVEEIFGFGSFSLQIEYNGSMNAFTIPLGYKLDVYNTRKNLKADKQSIKYDKEVDYSCLVFITSGLLFNEKINDREILAIILHEIGHNFSSSLNNNHAIFSMVQKAMIVVDTIENILIAILFEPKLFANIATNITTDFNFTQKIMIKIDNAIKQRANKLIIFADSVESMKLLINAYKILFKSLKIVLNDPLIIFKNLYLNIIKLIKAYNPMNIIRSLFLYNDEKVSDNFVTMFGYSSDLSSVLVKLNYPEINMIEKYAYEKSSFILHLINIILLPIQIIATGIDAHPTTAQRINDQLTYLEKELAKANLDPKMEKNIKDKIKETRKELEDIIFRNKNKKINKQDRYMIQKVYDTYIYNKFNEFDLREKVIHQDNYKEIDDIYNSKLSDKK